MFRFYRGEAIGSTNKEYMCYIMAHNPLEAENKLIAHFDENLSREYGELESSSIINVEPTEYFGLKKSNPKIFI